MDLLLSANHRQEKVSLGLKLINVERGQLITSQVALAKRWGWDRKTVNTFLKLTKSDEILDFQSSKEVDTGYTLVTIRNYSKYQDGENGALDIQTDIQRTSNGHPTDTLKELKNEKKEEGSGKPDSNPSSAIFNRTILRLNELAGTSFRTNTAATVRVIGARLSEGYTGEDLAMVLELKWSEWGDDKKMREYFRPETLFAAKHFEGYLQAAKANQNSNGHGTPPKVVQQDGDMLTLEDGSTINVATYERRYGVRP